MSHADSEEPGARSAPRTRHPTPSTKHPYRIGLAVSGGADSTALLVLMAGLQHELNFKAVVLNVDHGLEPANVDNPQLVKKLAKQFKLPFYSKRVTVVRRPRESLEMAARRVRLAALAEWMEQLKLDAIATGHHADDVAETFILRMARGAGPVGLAGLKRISHLEYPRITFIRPLLDLRDADLKDFLRARGIDWNEDPTNTDTSIPRNKVRHIILPWLRANLDPHITEHLCKSAAILRGDLGGQTPGTWGQTPEVGGQTPDIGGQTPGTWGQTPGTWGQTPGEIGGLSPCEKFKLTVSQSIGYKKRVCKFGEFPTGCAMARKALAGRMLVVRTWHAGDRIAPIGMGGQSRKLQDVFVTAKVPVALRKTLPLLADATTGEILWVPGYRIAHSVSADSMDTPTWNFELALQNQKSGAT